MTATTLWFPAFHQMRWQRNDSWLNSMWLGFVWPVLSLPEILFCNLIAPLCRLTWRWPILLVHRLWATVKLFIKLPLHGICGYASTEDITIDELRARLMTVQLRKALEETDGNDD